MWLQSAYGNIPGNQKKDRSQFAVSHVDGQLKEKNGTDEDKHLTSNISLRTYQDVALSLPVCRPGGAPPHGMARDCCVPPPLQRVSSHLLSLDSVYL